MSGNPEITPEVAARVLPGSFPGHLGIAFDALEEGRAIARMRVDERHLHPGGVVHGGAWTAFADTVAVWGTMRSLPAGAQFTTAELKMSLFGAARAGDVLVGEGELLHAGRRSQSWQVRVTREDRLLAVFGCTQIVLG